MNVFDDRSCGLGEGPLWHPERQQLFWFDIVGKRLMTRDSEGPKSWEFNDMVSAAGWVDAETLLIASEKALLRFDIASGESEPVSLVEHDKAGTRSNDGRADPHGGFWIGTMGKRAQPGAGAIYRFYGGHVDRLYSDVTVSNAICFAPDGRTAYFADTAVMKIMRQPLDAEGWPKGKPEVFVDLSKAGLRPDGAVVDAEGALWNAQYGAGRVARYLPDGSFDREIAIDASLTTCPAFGGPDFATLYVTTARQGLKSPSKGDGAVYDGPAGVAGRPEPRVKL
ncbi:SMP-30/gluconolactonase/LRE family protein [Salipiger mucosus]|uniref:1,4-lactonase n=1 Tax=Salipiger mucosus DSM 16094 TaxID=1123237 RepID=S9QVQ4_9RHOB|nr:SMP-30/gluconolactonase/LRE family protein [Salipiger mucosus]EPX83678.1 1,4-lactonase [Salipiger mucosus DSM 16094]